VISQRSPPYFCEIKLKIKHLWNSARSWGRRNLDLHWQEHIGKSDIPSILPLFFSVFSSSALLPSHKNTSIPGT
jgi:hypothetical protein